MRLTPRKSETEHVAAAIDKEHLTLDAAAKAAIKAVAECLDLRDWYALAAAGDGPTILWGIYSSEAEAKKAAASMKTLLGSQPVRVVPVFSLAGVLARVDGQPMPDDCKCGHQAALHQFHQSGRGKCGLSSCACTKFAKHDHPIPTHATCVTCKQPVMA